MKNEFLEAMGVAFIGLLAVATVFLLVLVFVTGADRGHLLSAASLCMGSQEKTSAQEARCGSIKAAVLDWAPKGESLDEALKAAGY